MTKTRPQSIPAYFDYLDPDLLRRYLNHFGKIKPRNRTGLSQKQQAALSKAIKRARHLALLPFVTEYVDVGRSFNSRRPRYDNNQRGDRGPSRGRN